MKYIILITLSVLHICETANILYLSLTPSKSHVLWDKTLALSLKNAHNITFVSYTDLKTEENFTTIQFKGVREKLESLGVFNLSNIKSKTAINDIKNIFDILKLFCKLNSQTNELKSLLQLASNNFKFDLIITDLLCSQCLYPLIEVFNFPPVIGTSPFGLTPFFWFNFGTDLHLSYVPLYKLAYTDKMSFFERIHNYFYTLLLLFWREYIFMPEQWEIAKNVFGNNISSFKTIEKHFSIVLANYDPILDYPQSVPPTIIPVGGLHTQRRDDIPKDIQKILNKSSEGIILFSLGSNIIASTLSNIQKTAIIKTFSKLNYTILWKYEGNLPNTSKNIITRQWLPQNSILQHPNVKLFITHAGALSIQEAIYHGVPIVAVPIFADQFYNAHKIVTRKLGASVKIEEITTNKFLNTINEVLHNKIYKKNVALISEKFRHHSKNPLEKAVYWVEYILKYGNTNDLHVESRNMSFYQILHLDIWCFILCNIILIHYCTKQIYKYINNKQNKI